MTLAPILFADFNNADSRGRVRLNCAGTISDLRAKNMGLREGLEVVLSDGELVAEGTVLWSREEAIWVAVIDWKRVRDV